MGEKLSIIYFSKEIAVNKNIFIMIL